MSSLFHARPSPTSFYHPHSRFCVIRTSVRCSPPPSLSSAGAANHEDDILARIDSFLKLDTEVSLFFCHRRPPVSRLLLHSSPKSGNFLRALLSAGKKMLRNPRNFRPPSPLSFSSNTFRGQNWEEKGKKGLKEKKE